MNSSLYDELKVSFACHVLCLLYEDISFVVYEESGQNQEAEPFFLMAGPNVIESEEHIFKMCRHLKEMTDRQVRSRALMAC